MGPSTKDGEVHNGRTWRDMPGNSREDRLMNWFRYKRGQLTEEYINTRGRCEQSRTLFSKRQACAK